MGGRYSAINVMCFAEFLLYYYITSYSIKDPESDYQPIVSDDELMESKDAKCYYPTLISLISSKEKFKCRNVKTVFRYHLPNPNRDIEKFAHHMLFSSYSFSIR